MKRVYVFCEGQTEESFVKELMYSSFLSNNIILFPIICTTKREKSGLKYKGGISSYAKIRAELLKLCLSHKHEYVTMLFDYYALPSDTPGMDNLPQGSSLDKILYLEESIGSDINLNNFIPNIVLHEFEGLLFSQPEAFSFCIKSKRDILKLMEIRDSHTSPEEIDDSPLTAPSKRILNIFPSYKKVLHGVNIAREIGMHTIAGECKHFSDWVLRILSLSEAEI